MTVSQAYLQLEFECLGGRIEVLPDRGRRFGLAIQEPPELLERNLTSVATRDSVPASRCFELYSRREILHVERCERSDVALNHLAGAGRVDQLGRLQGLPRFPVRVLVRLQRDRLSVELRTAGQLEGTQHEVIRAT